MVGPDLETFGDHLRSYRRAAGLTQEELADRAQVSPREISDLERGLRTRPRRDTIQYLAAALQLEPGDRAQLEAAARRPQVPTGTAVLADGPHSEASKPRHNLPLQLTSFVGRKGEQGDVERLLLDQESPTRLITLTGAGGCGKTRLAFQVAAGIVDRFVDGVWFIDLAPLNDPMLVPQTVAGALGVREVPGQPILATLIESLGSRQRLLLVDNCEHLIEACARLVDSLLQNCVRLSILATSREMLGVRGEIAFRVPSLALPDSQSILVVEDVRECEAVRLFVDRARAVVPSFEVTKENAAALAKVCLRLDGIPLAVELAAARVRVLTVEQIASRLDDRFRLLTGGSRSAMRRQQTLRALIDWSYDLLSTEERIVFRRLSVFAGGWTLEAAEAVCRGAGLEENDVLDLLTGLADKSLVAFEGQGEAKRYRFLETVRAYAEERLFESGEAALIRGQHYDWCLGLAEQADVGLLGRRQVDWLEILDLESDNLRTALEWSSESDSRSASRLAASLWFFWYIHARRTEGRHWLTTILERPSDDSRWRGVVMLGLAFIFREDLATLPASRSLTEECLPIFDELDDRRLSGWTLHNLGSVEMYEGKFSEAQVHLDGSVAAFRAIGDKFGMGMSLRDLALAIGQDDTIDQDDERATAALAESLALLKEQGDHWNLGWTLLWTANARMNQADWGRARALLDEAIGHFRTVGHTPGLVSAGQKLAQIDRETGDHRQARARLIETALASRNAGTALWGWETIFTIGVIDIGHGAVDEGLRLIAATTTHLPATYLGPTERVDRASSLTAARSALGEDAYARAWAEGQAMTFEQAVAYASEEAGHLGTE